MAKAFILLNADLGSEEDLIQQLRAVKGVVGVYVVYGVYDLVVVVEGENMQELKEVVVNRLRWAFSESSRVYEEHVKNCALCTQYRQKGVNLNALTREDAVHLLNPLPGMASLKRGIRSTLTLPVVEASKRWR